MSFLLRNSSQKENITLKKLYNFSFKIFNTQQKIHLRDPDALEEKIFRLKAGGVDNLQFIAGYIQILQNY